MAMRDPIPRKWTIDEWLAYEDETQTRYEFLDGEIYAMSGGTITHARLIARIFLALGQKLAGVGSSCEVLPADIRIEVSKSQYLYADMSVVCGKPLASDNHSNALTNPTLIVEVTSPSSVKYDTHTKLLLYKQIPSLQAYLVVHHHRMLAQLQVRHDDEAWLANDFTELESTIPLDTLNCELTMQEIYADIDIDTETET